MSEQPSETMPDMSAIDEMVKGMVANAANGITDTETVPETAPVEPAEPFDAQAYVDALIGTQVELEGGQIATVVAFPDDDHIAVTLADGSAELVAYGDVIRQIVPLVVEGHVEIDVDDETARMFSTAVMELSALIIKAGVTSIRGEGAEAEIVFPPEGFLPRDPEMFDIVEQACAIAVAALIRSFGLDVGVIVAGLDSLVIPQPEGDQETEAQ